MQEMTWTVSCAVAATEAASKERECSGPGADVSLRRATWGWARLEARMGRTDQQRKKEHGHRSGIDLWTSFHRGKIDYSHLLRL